MLDGDQVIEMLQAGTSCRGWISNSYAQVEFLLGDLIQRCRQFPEYDSFTQTISHSASKRVSKVRSIIAMDGPLSEHALPLEAVLEAFERQHETRNLLAHGFCEFHHTPDGDAGFAFRRFIRAANSESGHELLQKTFRLVDLEYHQAQMVEQASQRLSSFTRFTSRSGGVESYRKPCLKGERLRSALHTPSRFFPGSIYRRRMAALQDRWSALESPMLGS